MTLKCERRTSWWKESTHSLNMFLMIPSIQNLENNWPSFFSFQCFYIMHTSPSAPECYKRIHNEYVYTCTHLKSVFFLPFEGNKITVSHSLLPLLLPMNFLYGLVLPYFWPPSVNATRRQLIIQILRLCYIHYLILYVGLWGRKRKKDNRFVLVQKFVRIKTTY